jgi:hypothetical protein
MAPHHDLVDGFLRALKHRFDVSIAAVPNPSSQPEPASLLRGHLSEEDALDHPGNNDADPDHGGRKPIVEGEWNS